jgi:hypothetical protein
MGGAAYRLVNELVMPRRPRLVFQDNALLDPTRQAGLLDRVHQLGGTGIQQDVSWGDVRKGGTYDWSKLDQLVNAANARGEAPQFRLMGTSSGMVKSNPNVDAALNTQRPNAALLGQFARDVATHFGGRVSKYSIWNEPNIGPGRANLRQAARTYRQLYQAGYGAIKAANPNARVGFGEVVATDPNETGAGSAGGFIKAVLAAGNHPLKADYVALHPYQPTLSPKLGAVTRQQQAANPDYGGISYLGGIQDELAHAYARHQLQTTSGKRSPLALSEFGYQHSWTPNPHKRAQYLAAALAQARRAGVESMNLYQLMPTQNRASGWDSSILNAQGQADPVLRQALRKFRRG